MRRSLGPSTVTLGGLVKHLALVGDHYFTHQLLGRSYPDVPGPMTDDDGWDRASASADYPESLRSLWRQAVARSQAAVAEVLADDGLDRPLATSDWSETPNLRRVLVGMIEEYARHIGHANLIPESMVDRKVDWLRTVARGYTY